MKKKEIGERILVANGAVKFGTRPGYLDKLLGEKDVIRRVYNGSNIDVESEEYKRLCLNAYDDFVDSFHGDELEGKFKDIQKRYQVALNEAEKKNNLQLSKVAIDSLLLSNSLIGQAARVNQIPQIESFDKGLVESGQVISEGDFLDVSGIALEGMGNEEVLRGTDVVQTQSDSDNYLSTATKTVGDALNWLSERSNGIPYGMLVFAASRAANLPSAASAAIGAAAALSSAPKAEAVMVGDKDYKTTVYCGPEMGCERFKKYEKSDGIKLIEFDESQRVSIPDKETERLVFNAHGTKTGFQEYENKRMIQADEFSAKFFPNATVIQAIGCDIATNAEENFKENSLLGGDILFLQSGDESIAGALDYELVTYLVSQPNQKFPIPEPVKIIFKKDSSTTIFTGLNPAPLQEIENIISDPEVDNVTEKLFDLISNNVNDQRNLALSKEGIPQEKLDIIRSELERTGYKDYSQESDPEVKELFVKDFLSKAAMTPRLLLASNAVDLMRNLLENRLIDVNYKLHGKNIVMMAAALGIDGVIEVLAEHGCDLNEVDDEGRTPVFLAASKGYHKIIDIAAKYGADLNKTSNKGATPALIAAQKGHLETIKSLRANGADLHRECNGVSTIYIAAQNGHHEVVEFLADNKVDVDGTTYDGLTPAAIAAQKGFVRVLKVLAKNKADFNKASNDNVTPLFRAISSYQNSGSVGDKERLRHTIIFMVENGANPEFKTPFGTAYEFSVDEALNRKIRKTREEYLRKVEEEKANDQRKALAIAVENRDYDSIKSLLAAGVDVNFIDNNGETALLKAVKGNDVEAVKILLGSKETDPNIKDANGWAPIFHALDKNNEQMFDLLLSNPRTDLNIRENKNFTILGFAMYKGNVAFTEKLISDSRTDRDALFASSQRTAFTYAAETGKEEFMDLFLRNGLDPNKKDGKGWTPLGTAIDFGKYSFTEKLLSDSRTDRDAFLGSNQQTAFTYALATGKEEFIDLFLRSGLDPNKKDGKGWTPLGMAIGFGKYLVAEKLISDSRTDRDAFFVDSQRTAFTYAAELGREEFIDLFLRSGFDPNKKDGRGWTPLNTAIGFEKESVAKKLISHKETDRNLDTLSWTPLMFAVNNDNILSALLEEGVDPSKKNNQGKTALDIAKEPNPDPAKASTRDLAVKKIEAFLTKAPQPSARNSEAEPLVSKVREL